MKIKMNNSQITCILPAEWNRQRFVQLTWPHPQTDWEYMLDEAVDCFIAIAKIIIKYEKLIIVCPIIDEVKKQLNLTDYTMIHFVELPTNDTWARDHGGITVLENGKPTIYDFMFNGWGMKFAANYDNQLTKKLYETGIFGKDTAYRNCQGLVLEGGSIESDGKGTLLTTSSCLVSDNRNNKTKEQLEEQLIKMFGVQQVLWLNHGYLAGDDTDGHIDTLARLCPADTIAYVQCTDMLDEHYQELKKMEDELCTFKTTEGRPFKLVALPMADPVYEDGERLPATYANFLIMNEAVLVPCYDSPKDTIAIQLLKGIFPDREIIGINCLPLIKQHGSLHCVTMQYV